LIYSQKMKDTYINIVILVEGQTEETFIKEVLAPHLISFNVTTTSTIINTKIVNNGPNFKGGAVSYGKASRDLRKLLTDTSIYVTTFFDYYRSATDFPKMAEAKSGDKTIYQRIEILENAFD